MPTSHQDLKSCHSRNLAPRRPIHESVQKYEEENSEEEEEDDDDDEEIDVNFRQNYKNLYPDLRKDLNRVQQQIKSFDSKKKSNKPKPSVKFERTAYEKGSSSIWKIVIYILLTIFAVIGIGCKFFFSSYGGQGKSVPGVDITELIADMQNHFKEQQPETFRLLKSSLKRVVNEKHEPSAPAIVTIIVNKGAENKASDFSTYLANALAPGKYVSINESGNWHHNPEGLKVKIDDKVKSKLENMNFNVVVVDSLHNIPIDAAMIFHGYCDHEYAPYKRALYVFIVHLNVSIPENSSSKYLDTVAMNSLRNIWHSATDDKVDSLVTRITGTVVNIK